MRYSLFLSQKTGCTTFCIVIAALTRMYNHLVLSLAGRYELCRLRASREDAFREGDEKRKDMQPVHRNRPIKMKTFKDIISIDQRVLVDFFATRCLQRAELLATINPFLK